MLHMDINIVRLGNNRSCVQNLHCCSEKIYSARDTNMFSLESFLGDVISTSVHQMLTKFSEKPDERLMFSRQANGSSDIKRLSCPELRQLSRNSKNSANSASSQELTKYSMGSYNHRAKRRQSTPLNIARFKTIIENSDTESTDNNTSPPKVDRRRSSFYIGTTCEETDEEESDSDQTTSDLTHVNFTRRQSIRTKNSFVASEVNELSNRRLSIDSTCTVVNDDSLNDYEDDTFDCLKSPERSLNILVSLFKSENGTKGLTDEEILLLVEAKVTY